jgi:hypothetical protein
MPSTLCARSRPAGLMRRRRSFSGGPGSEALRAAPFPSGSVRTSRHAIARQATSATIRGCGPAASRARPRAPTPGRPRGRHPTSRRSRVPILRFMRAGTVTRLTGRPRGGGRSRQGPVGCRTGAFHAQVLRRWVATRTSTAPRSPFRSRTSPGACSGGSGERGRGRRRRATRPDLPPRRSAAGRRPTRRADAPRLAGPSAPSAAGRDGAVSISDRNPSALPRRSARAEARIHRARQEVPTG